MSTLWTVFRKELTETLRDRRTMFNAFVLSPLLTPALMLGMFTLMAKKTTEQVEKVLELPVVGAEHAPKLMDWLSSRGVEIEKPPADPDEAVRQQDEDVILEIGADYAEDWRKGMPAAVEIVHDSSRQDARVVVQRVESLLANYSQSVGTLRLVARGVHPGVVTAVQVGHRDLATPESRAGLALSFMPYLLIFGGFLGGAYLAIDATAGERERQSLEPLLATPAAREGIMSGKLAAASVFSLASLALTIVAFKLGFKFMPTGKLGIVIDISTLAMLKVYLAVLPVVLFGSCLLTLLAAFSKTVKEAQSYMPILMLLPMIPTIILMVSPVKTQLWMLAVPFLAQNQLIMMVLRAEPISAVQWAVGIGAGLLVAAVVWAIAARLYHREQLAVSA